MKAVEGQISLWEAMELLAGRELKEEPPVLLQPKQNVYIVKRGDVKEATVLDETWLCDETRGYRLQYGGGTYDCVWNTSIGMNCFLDMAPAVAKAEKYLNEHEVIRAEDIHPVSVTAFAYKRHNDYVEDVAFYCELDNGMLYVKEFMTYQHIVCADKKKKAIKHFMEQAEFKRDGIKPIEYAPVFKNMYKIHQKYDWDYAEAEHSYAVG